MSRTKKLKDTFDASVVTGTYSNADWQAIRASLAAVGVDLDATKAGEVQELAQYYSARSRLGGPLTPKQQATELKNDLAVLKAAGVSSVAGHHVDAALTVRVYTGLADLIPRLQRHLDKLTAMGSRSNKSARKLHVEYWIELTRLWWKLTADANRRRHEDLHRFLFSCSAPLFPEKVTKDKTLTGLTAFINRHLRKRAPKTSRRLREQNC
jgi:hypothetical protein